MTEYDLGSESNPYSVKAVDEPAWVDGGCNDCHTLDDYCESIECKEYNASITYTETLRKG